MYKSVITSSSNPFPTTNSSSNSVIGNNANTFANTVAVVGGGIIGTCIALQLQKSGKQVTLIERDKDCNGASSGNAGHIATEQVHPVASLGILKQIPSMLFDPLGALRIDYRYLPQLMPWFVKLLLALLPKPYQHSCSALQVINGQALAEWQGLLAEENLSHLMPVNGSYLVAEKQSSLQNLQQQITGLEKSGVTVDFIEQNQLLNELPILNDKQLGGLFFPETAHVVNPKTVCQSLMAQFCKHGGQLIYDEVVNVQEQETCVDVGLKNSNELLTVDKAVIACGIFSKQLVKQLTNINPPLQAERGYHLMTDLSDPQNSNLTTSSSTPIIEPLISAPVSSIDRRFIMTPMEHGLRLAGTVEYSTTHASPNYQRATNLLPLANGMLNQPLKAIDKPWMGLRPTLPDSLPVIDRRGRIGYAFGHQHLGLTQSAITAKWITDLMNDRQPSVDLSAYRLGRF